MMKQCEKTNRVDSRPLSLVCFRKSHPRTSRGICRRWGVGISMGLAGAPHAGKFAGAVGALEAVGVGGPRPGFVLVAHADQLKHPRLAALGQFGFQAFHAIAHLVAQVGLSHGRNVARGLIEEVHPWPLDVKVEEFACIAHRDIAHSRAPFIDVGGTTVPHGRLVPGLSSQLSIPTLDKMRQRFR